MKTLTVAKRFCGPPTSANGGYFAGLVAGLVPHTVALRLQNPPLLETELAVHELPDDSVEVRHGELLVGSASPTTLDLQPPSAPEYLQAVEASRAFVGFGHHIFPTCFVCGVQRSRHDGLCIYAGRVPDREIVAAPWVPDTSLDRGDGKVRAEFMSAALDCPGYFAVCPGDRVLLLAEFAVHLDRLVHIGESCMVIGWQMSGSAGKHHAGTAIFDGDGELCGRAQALWIEPRGASA